MGYGGQSDAPAASLPAESVTPDAPADADAVLAAPAASTVERRAIELPRRLPLWRFYLYCLASAGLFLVAWIFFTAWALAPSRRRAKHIGWALASLFPPFGCLVLFELCRLVGTSGSSRDGAPWSRAKRR